MKFYSFLLCLLLGGLSTMGCAQEPQASYGLVPFSTEVTSDDYPRLRDTNVTAEALSALQEDGLNIELATGPHEGVGYVDGLMPLNLTLGLREDDKIKNWLTQKTKDKNYQAIIFGHLLQEGEGFRVVMRIHRNDISGYESYGENRGITREEVNRENLVTLIQQAAEDVITALTKANAEQPSEATASDPAQTPANNAQN